MDLCIDEKDEERESEAQPAVPGGRREVGGGGRAGWRAARGSGGSESIFSTTDPCRVGSIWSPCHGSVPCRVTIRPPCSGTQVHS